MNHEHLNYGNFVEYIRHLRNKHTWDLTKDNFNDQSEETKTFIGELLK